MAFETEPEELARIRSAYERYESSAIERRRRDPLNDGVRMVIDEWRSQLLQRLGAHGLPRFDSRVLDIGCADGGLLEWFVQQGVHPSRCAGIDLVQGRARAAAERLPEAQIICGNAADLPFVSGSFDIVVLSMVVSSIRSRVLAREICRRAALALAPDGVIVWYDTRYPNPFNRDVRRVGARQIEDLFPDFVIDRESITLLPPLARSLGGLAGTLYPLLAGISPLRARYLALLFRRD